MKKIFLSFNKCLMANSAQAIAELALVLPLLLFLVLFGIYWQFGQNQLFESFQEIRKGAWYPGNKISQSKINNSKGSGLRSGQRSVFLDRNHLSSVYRGKVVLSKKIEVFNFSRLGSFFRDETANKHQSVKIPLAISLERGTGSLDPRDKTSTIKRLETNIASRHLPGYSNEYLRRTR